MSITPDETANFQLLQDATRRMSAGADAGQDDAEQDTKVAVVEDSTTTPDETPTPSQPESPTLDQNTAQGVAPVVDGDRTSSVQTAAITDPEIEEALRQLKAGEHLPDQDTRTGAPTPGPNGAPSGTPSVRRRAVYTREQKLAGLHYAKHSHQTLADGTRRPLTGPEAAHNLNVSWTVLSQWQKDEEKILASNPGTQKMRWAKRKANGLNGPEADRNQVRKTVSHQTPGGRPAPPPNSTPNGIFAAPPVDPSYRRTSQHLTPAQHYQTHSARAAYGQPRPPHQSPQMPGGWGSTPSHGGGLVSYELPWSATPQPRRPVQQLCSTLDASSQAHNSDIQYAIIAGSKITDSTVISCKVSASRIEKNATITQSTITACSASQDCDINCCTVENSVIMNAKLTDCNVVNSRISGGVHLGKNFLGVDVMGRESQPRPTPAKTAPIQTQTTNGYAAAAATNGNDDSDSDDGD